tara:strand:- start:378 stop:758 length:381 start_codon:yes stop_codon:yes gene_type:complete
MSYKGIYNTRGQIIDIKREKISLKNGESTSKVIIVVKETETGFNHVHPYEIFGDAKLKLFEDKLEKEKFAKIDFYIKTNPWKDKFFTTLHVQELRIEDDLVLPDEKYTDAINEINANKKKEEDLPF